MESPFDPDVLPRLPDAVLPNPALLAKLDAWTAVTVVSGGHGYGKSTLVASWLADQDPHQVLPIWIATTSELGERDQFLGHLTVRLRPLARAANVEPQSRPALVELDESLLALPTDQRVVLVIDDFDHMHDPALVHDLLNLVRRHPRLHLIACVHSAHPIAHLAAAAVEITCLDPEELLLTLPQVARLAESMARPLSPASVQTIFDAVGGWIAPLRLIIDASTDERISTSLAEAYLRETVLPSIDEPALLSHLMRFSLAERLSASLVRDVVSFDHLAPGSGDDPDAVIRLLQRPGLLQTRRDGEREMIIYPSLIRTVLRRAYVASDPSGATAFHAWLARWYAVREGREGAMFAFAHALAGRDYPLAALLVQDHGVNLILADPSTTARLTKEIPTTAQIAHPALAVVAKAGQSMVLGIDRAALLDRYAQACTQVAAKGLDKLPPSTRLFAGSAHIARLRRDGHLDRAGRFATTLWPQVSVLENAPYRPSAGLASFHLEHGITMLLLGDDMAASGCLRRSWRDSVRAGADHLAARSAAYLGLLSAIRGESDEAEEWLDCWRQRADPSHWDHAEPNCAAQVAIGILALDQLDGAVTRTVLDRLRVDVSGQDDLWPFVAALRAKWGLQFGRPELALTGFDVELATHNVSLSSVPTSIAAGLLLLRTRIDLLVAAGHGQAADLLLGPHDTRSGMLGVSFARVALLAGAYGKAERILERLLRQPHLAPRDRLDLLLLGAIGSLHSGDEGLAAQRMEEAVELAGHIRIRQAFGGLPKSIRADLLRLVPDLDPSVRDGLFKLRVLYPAQLRLISLTERESALLGELLHTSSRHELANKLYITLNTVKKHHTSLYRKLGTTNRLETLQRARELGLLSESA